MLLPRDQSEEKRPSFWYLHPRYQSEERHCLWPPVSDQTYFSRSRPLLYAVAPRSIGREAPELLVSSSPISIGSGASGFQSGYSLTLQRHEIGFWQKRTAGIEPTRSTPVRNMPERLRDGIYRLGRGTANTSHKGEPYYE